MRIGKAAKVPRTPANRSNRRGTPAAPRGEAYSTETPTAGCYRIRLTKGGPFVALRIWHGQSLDPVTGEEMIERPLFWQCRLNGTQFVPVEDFWPFCAQHKISRAEYARICRLSRTMNPKHPYYDPRRAINSMVAPVPF
jgi:hypothetical protein